MGKENVYAYDLKDTVREQKIEVLSMVEDRTKEVLAKVPEHHGWEHTELVEHFAKLISLAKGKDPFEAQVASLLHDWGRVEENGNLSVKKPHAAISGEVSRTFLKKFCEEGKLSVEQYGRIERAVRRHSGRNETPNETVLLVRDADRVSRFGALGLYHIVQAANERGIPFYGGGEITRSDDAPFMERKDIKSVIDDINFSLEWEKMITSQPAKEIVSILKMINQIFLELFKKHREIRDGEFWLIFLNSTAEMFRKKWAEFNKNYQWNETLEDYNSWLKFYQSLGGREMFTERRFTSLFESYTSLKFK